MYSLQHKVLKYIFGLLMLVGSWVDMNAFDGSKPEAGKSYYLFNMYQGKFLGADCKLSRSGAALFAVAENTMTVGGKSWTLAEKDKFYQLKNGDELFAFEDKVVDPENPTDENRALYLGGGVTCQPSTNDTDRSYWQLISEEEYAEWLAKKKFTVSSLNVDGMPKSVNLVVDISLNPDAKEGPGATLIGKRLAVSGIDVVGLSEDFNYHNNIMAEVRPFGYNDMTHRGGISVGEANLLNFVSQKPLFDSDGLGLVYKTAEMTPTNETFVQWNQHNGYTDQGADGLIKKGYRYYLLTLDDGTEVDLYTMHMDADDGQADREARASQLRQLVAAIKATNNKRPIIIIGDSNCRYTRDKVKSILIDGINADERFTIRDPWIQYGRNGIYPAYPSGSIMASVNGYLSGEVVDKIWYINNKQCDIRIVAETYCQDLSFVDDEGSPLCDHKPCAVTFSYHDFDPAIDDQPVDEKEDDSAMYLRNRQTGRYLKSGADWGTHSVVGNYPIGFSLAQNDGKYSLRSEAGYVTCEADNVKSFIDGSDNESRSVKDWELMEHDGFYVLAHDGRALSANSSSYLNDDPNYRMVVLEELNPDDKNQQWEMLTKEQMKEEMFKANAENPVNASWLMSNPNFDRNLNTSKWDNSISGDATRMWSNYGDNEDGMNEGGLNDNLCAEAYVNKCPKTHIGSCDHATTWDINQTLTGVPNGWYRVSCQAFQRISNSNTTTATIQLYGNDVAQQVELMYNLKAETTNAIGSKKDGNYYYPDNMSEASQYFLKGYYQNYVWVNVTNGMLKVGVRKTSDTGKSNTAWCCFDNFQLYYFGAEKPADELGVNVIEETRKVELVDEAWKMSGTWSEENMAELNSKISGENAKLVLDATNANLVCRPEVKAIEEVPNMMIKVVDASEIANTDNVIANGECVQLVLADKKDFAPQQTFMAQNVNYVRTNTKGYNTVCMPFGTTPADYKGCTVYEYTRINESTITFTEVAEDATIEAGTPVLVYSEGGEDWTMSLAERSVVPTATGDTAFGEVAGLNGAFVNRTIGEGYYKLNSAGTAFAVTTSAGKIVPFRFYLKADGQSASASSFQIVFGDDEETGIEEFLNSENANVEHTYDISGRRVINITRPGIYVKGGKKVFIK